MKLFISVDMEGIAGIVSNYEEFNERDLYRDSIMFQIKSIVKGIQSCAHNEEIEEITICDSHSEGKSIVYRDVSKLDDRIRLISGSPRKTFMVSTIDNSYDGVIFVGYHAGAGTMYGNMEHSFFGKVVHRIYVNDIPVNESMVNAIHSKDNGVPVILIVGDNKLKEQLDSLGFLSDVPYVVTKESISRYSAKYTARKSLKKDSIEKTKWAVENIANMNFIDINAPYSLRIEFNRTIMADYVELIPGVERIDAYNIGFECSNSMDLICAISAFTRLAGTAE